MSLDSLLGAILLGAGLAALWLGAVRVASPIAPHGAERLLAAASVAAAAAVIEALVLGRIGLGTEPWALLASSIGLWALARWTLPAPAIPPAREIANRWSAADPPARVASGAAAGLLAALGAFALIEPTYDLDSVFYHLSEVTAWIENGRPGSIELISNVYPIGAYPSTNETLMSWLGGVSGNVAPILLWPVAMAALLLVATATTLRSLGCRPFETVAGTAALMLVPLVVGASGSLDTDLPSTAWVAVCVALSASVAARRSPPELLAFAIVAFGLALGTKTSVLVLGALALGVALVAAPRLPRPRPVLLAGAVAVAVGGVWYLRNLADHGSPLWPFVDLPFGDPIPAGIDSLSTTFASRPLETLDGRIGAYVEELGAGLLLLAAAVVLPLAARDRRLLLGSGAVALGAILWSVAPATGETPGDGEAFFTVTGVRYLISTALLATLVVALVARRDDRLGQIARAVLVASIVWGAIELVTPRDGTPDILVVLAGTAAGALAGWLAPRSGPRRMAAIAGAGVVTLLVVVCLYPAIYLDRYAARAAGDPVQPPVLFGGLSQFFEEQEGLGGDGPIGFADGIVAPLSGAEFDREVLLLPETVTCAQTRMSTAGGWAVVSDSPSSGLPAAPAACFRGEEPVLTIELGTGTSVRVYAVPDAI